MKKLILFLSVLILLLTACSSNDGAGSDNSSDVSINASHDHDHNHDHDLVDTEESEINSISVLPMPFDPDDISNCTLSALLEEGCISTDSDGTYLITATLFHHDLYEASQVSLLKEGDHIIIRNTSIAISSIRKNSVGTIIINGGPNKGGCELRTDDNLVYYEVGYKGGKAWKEIGQVTLPLSSAFHYTDRSDSSTLPRVYTISDLLSAHSGIRYPLSHNNTSIVIEDGIVVAMQRTDIR